MYGCSWAPCVLCCVGKWCWVGLHHYACQIRGLQKVLLMAVTGLLLWMPLEALLLWDSTFCFPFGLRVTSAKAPFLPLSPSHTHTHTWITPTNPAPQYIHKHTHTHLGSTLCLTVGQGAQSLVKGALWFCPLWSGFCHLLPPTGRGEVSAEMPWHLAPLDYTQHSEYHLGLTIQPFAFIRFPVFPEFCQCFFHTEDVWYIARLGPVSISMLIRSIKVKSMYAAWTVY